MIRAAHWCAAALGVAVCGAAAQGGAPLETPMAAASAAASAPAPAATTAATTAPVVAPPQDVAREPVAVVLPTAVVWRGVPAPAGEGTTGGMLYPAPTPLAGLAAVLTHSLLVSGSRAAEAQRLQEEADRSLSPYQPALSAWTPQALYDAALPQSLALPRAVDAATSAGAERWRLVSLPVFALHADRSRLVLDNQVRIADARGDGKPFDVMVRVVSARRVGDAAYDAADEAAELKRESARLLAHSIDLALQARRQPLADDTPYRTHRYQDGAREGLERGQLLGAGCSRLVMRTLRGWLLSVPPKADGAADCAGDPYAFAPVAAR